MIFIIILVVINIILLTIILIAIQKRAGDGLDKQTISEIVRGEFQINRKEAAEDVQRLRQEVTRGQKETTDTVVKVIGEASKSQMESSAERLDAVEGRVRSLVDSNEVRLDKLRGTVDSQMKSLLEYNEKKLEQMRQTVDEKLQETTDTVVKVIGEASKSQMESSAERLDAVEGRVRSLVDSNEVRLDKLRETVDSQMKSLLGHNEKKLEQMRQTVDEKLQSTLEKRLGESFKLVSERLEAVQQGLGDMQSLATGVGDLKRMLTNVKARGTWGEYQLGDILEQLLTPDQFRKNIQPKSGSSETVEYAILLPGQDNSSRVYLPIDSKFPQADYQRLIDASEAANSDAVEKSTASLVRNIQSSAKDIANKYIDPPHTTDFAIMFLPTEGLYSEVLRQPGMVEDLQIQYRVVVAGPTTLSAILNSLRMGFRTLAIEKRSSEVWNILSAVKTEFNKFGDVLSKLKKQLETASNTIEQTSVRTRQMKRKLQSVEELTTDKSAKLLELDYIDVDVTDMKDDIEDSSQSPMGLGDINKGEINRPKKSHRGANTDKNVQHYKGES